ncbi:ParB N-terminal domain-containing protein [Plastoroseomonas hellenica]|uniref:ParB N-terminal domain-containing protein n=1 Tax=Plastoroseomonas hellenica TaxID=2687306 RepID=UPI001BAB2F54|nr:ParB N-terminal domain-containing protein [Plastoroseomonas hellenica]
MNSPANTLTVPLDEIEIGPRLRLVDEDHAAFIAQSFAEAGQLTPVEVRPHPDAKSKFKYRLTAGAHRMAAAKMAGFDGIRVEVREVSEVEARLREIDENLCRHELTELDRAVFLAERKKVWLQLHPETGAGGKRRGGDQNDKSVALFPAFSKATADKLGISRRSVERAVRRSEALDNKVRAQLAGTRWARRGSELDALTRHPKDVQRKIVALLLHATDPASSVAAASARLSGKTAEVVDQADLQFGRLLRLWNAAGAKAQRLFVDHLTHNGELGAAQDAAAAAAQRSAAA